MTVLLGFITLVSLVVLGAGFLALLIGGIEQLRIKTRKTAGIVMAVSAAVMIVAASMAPPAPTSRKKDADSKRAAQSSKTVADPTPVLPAGVPLGSQPASVERVVDGDTVWVYVPDRGGALTAGASHNIRLLEVDTPETQHPTKGQECFGPEATEFTEGRLPVGTTVYLQSDEEDKDQYGRFLRYIWLEDGTLFNETLATEGYARAVLYEPNDLHIDRIRAAEASAQAGKGLWGPPCMGQTVKPEPSPSPAAAVAPPPPNGKPKCDPAYPGVCIPPPPPDLDCGEISLRNFKVLAPDPHRFDGDKDGIGCESGSSSTGGWTSSQPPPSSAPPPPPPPPPAPAPSPASGNCHPSYPSVCIAPPPPDLDCGEISHRRFTVRWDVSNPDPHGFDGDKDGIGCES